VSIVESSQPECRLARINEMSQVTEGRLTMAASQWSSLMSNITSGWNLDRLGRKSCRREQSKVLLDHRQFEMERDTFDLLKYSIGRSG
jgi:hypothetical protein